MFQQMMHIQNINTDVKKDDRLVTLLFFVLGF